MHALHARRCGHREVVRGYRHRPLDTQQCAEALSGLGDPKQQLDARRFESAGGLCRREALQGEERIGPMAEACGDVLAH